MSAAAPLGRAVDILCSLLRAMRLGEPLPVLTAVTASALALALGYRFVQRAQRPARQAQPGFDAADLLLEDDGPEIPDEFRDPITFSVRDVP